MSGNYKFTEGKNTIYTLNADKIKTLEDVKRVLDFFAY